ncbi:Hypothetical protein A7982_07627 [Minicystis rosea]|nr:Hypothetical protein A7982_07627 [Minicystis rosea]
MGGDRSGSGCDGRARYHARMDGEDRPALRIAHTHASIQHKGVARRLFAGAVGLLVLAIALVASFKRHDFGGLVGPIATFAFFGAPALAVLAFFTRIYFRWQRGTVAVIGDDLVIERGRRVTRVPRSELVEGSIHPTTRQVEIKRKNGDILRIDVPHVEDGQRLLAATGLDAAQRTRTLMLGETTFLDCLSVLLGPIAAVWMAKLASVPFGAKPLIGIASFFLSWIGIFLGVREIFGPARVVIGADGVVVRQRFRRWFHRHEEIADIEGDAGYTALWLRLKKGRAVRLRTRHLSTDQQGELTLRLADARRAWQLGDAGNAALAALDRGGRTIAAWRAALAAVQSRRDAYRGREITRDDLLGVLESPAAPVERRVAAALALANDEAARPRIRIAAEASADTRVRVALHKAAEGSLDDDALEEIAKEADEARTLTR